MTYLNSYLVMLNTELNRFLPKDNNGWISAYAKSLGWDFLTEYYNKLFVRMIQMKHGDKIDILKEVNPDNYDLFVKCLITCISELAGYGIYDYSVEDNIILKG